MIIGCGVVFCVLSFLGFQPQWRGAGPEGLARHPSPNRANWICRAGRVLSTVKFRHNHYSRLYNSTRNSIPCENKLILDWSSSSLSFTHFIVSQQNIEILSFFRFKSHSCTIHTISHPSGLRTIRKHMPQVPLTGVTSNFSSGHEQHALIQR